VTLDQGNDIAERLLDLGVAALHAGRRLAQDSLSRHIGIQLVRSATSSGANYEEARSAESRADFIHKVSIAAKEVREASYWLRLALRADLAKDLAPLIAEADELAAILTASARTARRNAL
jgi:four helix bundle protein